MARLISTPLILAGSVVVSAFGFALHGRAAPAVPYTENFTTTANWSTASGSSPTAPTLVPAGGPDGSSYVSRSASAAGAPDLVPAIPVITFRAQDNFGSSGNQFFGDWIAGGLNEVSLYVRHNASVPLPFFLRFTPPAGTPGVIFETSSSTPASNDWTKLTFVVSPSSPYFTPEGPPSLFSSIMGDVGRMQFGYSVPVGFGMDPNTYTFEMDLVATNTPEPTSWLLVAGGATFGWAFRRKRSAC